MDEKLKSIIDQYNSKGWGSSKIASFLIGSYDIEVPYDQLVYIIDEYNAGSLGQEPPQQESDEELKKKGLGQVDGEVYTLLGAESSSQEPSVDSTLSLDPLDLNLESDLTQRADVTSQAPPALEDIQARTTSFERESAQDLRQESRDLSAEIEAKSKEISKLKQEAPDMLDFGAKAKFVSDEINQAKVEGLEKELTDLEKDRELSQEKFAAQREVNVELEESFGDKGWGNVQSDYLKNVDEFDKIEKLIAEKKSEIAEIEDAAERFASNGFGKKENILALQQSKIDELNKEIDTLQSKAFDFSERVESGLYIKTRSALKSVAGGRFFGATMTEDEARTLAEETQLLMNEPSVTVDQVYESMVKDNLVMIDKDAVFQDKLYNDLGVARYDKENLYKVDYRKKDLSDQFKISQQQFSASPDEYLSKVPVELRNFEDAKSKYKSMYNVDLSESDYLDLVSFWNYRDSALSAVENNEFIEDSIIKDYKDLIKNSTDENLQSNYFKFLNQNRQEFNQYNKNIDILGYGDKVENIIGLLNKSLKDDVSESISDYLSSYMDSDYKAGFNEFSSDSSNRTISSFDVEVVDSGKLKGGWNKQTGVDRMLSKFLLNTSAGVLDLFDMLQDYEKEDDDSPWWNLLYLTPASVAKAFADSGGGEGIINFQEISESFKERARGIEEYDRINMGLTLTDSQKEISKLIAEGNYGASVKKGVIGVSNIIPQIALVIAAPELAIPLFGVSSAGGMYSEIQDLDHITYGEKVRASVIMGAAEAATEYLFRGQEVVIKEIAKNVLKRKALGKGILDEAAKKAIAKQANTMFKFNPKSKGGKMFLKAFQFQEEGVEELIVDVVDQNITNYLEKKSLNEEHFDLKYKLEDAPNSIVREQILDEIQANRESYSEIGYNIYQTMDSYGLGLVGAGGPLMLTRSLGYIASPGKIKSRIQISKRITELDKLINEEVDMGERIKLKSEKAELIRKQFSDVAMDQQLLEKMSEADVDELIKLNHEISKARFSSRKLRSMINESMSKEEQDRIYESIMKNAAKAKKALESKTEIYDRYNTEQNKLDQNSLTDEELALVNEIESLDTEIDTFDSVPNSDGFIDVTLDNVNSVIDKLLSSSIIKSTRFSTAQQIKDGLRNVAKIVKEVKSAGGSVRIFTNKKDFERVTGQSISRGLHTEGKGKDSIVSLYLPALRANTSYHEAFHDIVLRKLGAGKIQELALSLAKAIPNDLISKYVTVMELTEQQLIDVKDLKGYDLLKYIISEDKGRAEEFLVEVLADISNGDYSISFKNGLIQNLKEFVAKFFGTTFKDPKIKDVVSAIKTATEQLAEGKQVTALDEIGREGETESDSPKRNRAKKQVIGENAELAAYELGMLDEALAMEKEGYTPKVIFSSTGWEKGADGKWRMLITEGIEDYYDIGLDIQEELLNTEETEILYGFDEETGMEIPYTSSSISKKGEEILPESILNLYPSLKKLNITFHKDNLPKDESGTIKGSYSSLLNTIDVVVEMEYFDLKKGDNIDDYYESMGLFPEHSLTLAHEVQHAIQEIEGFERGDNTGRTDIAAPMVYSYQLFNDKGSDAPKVENIVVEEKQNENGETVYSVVDNNNTAVYKEYGEFNTKEEAESVREKVVGDFKTKSELITKRFPDFSIESMKDEYTSKQVKYLAYKSAMGEVEARSVSKMMEMTDPQQRESMSPSELLELVNDGDAVIIQRGISKKQTIGDEGSDSDFDFLDTSMDPRQDPNKKLRQTIATAIDKYPSLREEMLANPDNYITPQNLEELRGTLSDENVTDADLIDKMTDDGLGRLQNRNDDLAILALNELINRALAKGDMEAVSKYETNRAQIGTTAGRMLNHLRTLKSTTASGLARQIELEIAKKGNVLSEEQRARLIKKFDVILKLHRDYKKMALEISKMDIVSDQTEKDVKKLSKEILEKEKDLNVYLSRIVEKGWGDIATMLVQGNLLTPISQVTNIGANFVNIFKTFFTDMVAFPIEKVLNLVGVESKIKRQYSLGAYLYAGKAGLIGFGDTIVSSFTGRGMDATSEWRMQRGFYPIQSLITLFTKKDLPLKAAGKRKGKTSISQRIKMFVAGTTGAAAETSFRTLSLGDVPFRKYAAGLELYRIAKAKGLKGKEKQKFLKYPDKKSLAFAEKQGRKVTFQEDTEVSKGAMASVRAFQKGVASSINKASGGLINGEEWGKFIVRTFLPYVNTPANIFDDTMTYMVPYYALIKIGKDIKNKDAISASQNFGKMMVGSMAVQVGMILIKEGLITGAIEWDEETEKKNLMYDQMPPQSVNADGLKRLIRGEDPSWREGDEYKAYYKLGIIGQVLASVVKATDPDEVRKRDYSDFKFFHHAFNDSFGLNLLSGASNILDQSFLQGIDGILNVLTSDSEDDFERQTERLVNSVVKASSSVALPNTMSATARAQRDYMPDYRLDKNISSSERMLKNFIYVVKDRFWQDRNVPMRIDWKGEKVLQTPEGSNSIAYQLFDITKSRKGSSDPISNEIMRLYQETGVVTEAMSTPMYANNRKIIVPKATRQKKYIDNKYTFLKDPGFVGERIYFSIEQCNKLMEVAGKQRYKHLEYVINSNEYIDADDDKKLRILDDVAENYNGLLEINKGGKKLWNHSYLALDFLQEIYEKQKADE
tara:strand:+ start:486 stop:8396 length:7911 start_codon:yes stop_codon:yes gene_type:complete